MEENSIQVTEDIVKSPNDDRNYGYVQFDNGMKVLLVTDQTTEKAAAALSVRVGHLCDPDEIPGLAHLCEHMLFLGTEKYPSENEYTQFLSHHGGSSNAFTSKEYTTYFFDVAHEHLKGALDRFSQFFHCPLFNPDAKDREINAVDSENNKNLQVDSWRYHQVSHTISRPGHPYSKFGTGSKLTLETHPRELGLDVREELLKFHSQHYSSNLMALAILGRESINELASLAHQLFSPVTNKNNPIPEFPIPPYSDEQLQIWIEYVPVKELRQLVLEFPLPDLTAHYTSDPTLYAAHLIGHEGPGSLLSYLKTQGWCQTLAAGPSHGAKGFMFFSVQMDVTVAGEDHIKDIVTALFQYLAMLRREGPQEWVFRECADLNAIDFRFKDKPKPRGYVTFLTQALHEYSPCDVLSGSYLLTQFRPDLIQLVLDKLLPQFVRVGVKSRKFEGQTIKTEPWYGSSYNVRKIDESLIELWNGIEPIKELHLPAVNEFIPTDFDRVLLDRDKAPKVPTLILDSEMCKVWYKQDDMFGSPKACIYFLISTPLAYKDPTSCSLTSLFVRLLKDELNEFAYNAEISGIDYDIVLSIYGINVQISGYNHKQPILLSKIMTKLAKFSVDEKRFEIEKEILERQLRNFKAEQPYMHAKYYQSLLMDNCVWTKEELATALEVTTTEQLQQFLAELLAQVHVEALVHGNISQQGCLDVVTIIERSLRTEANSQAIPQSQIHRHNEFKLPDGSSFCFATKNEVHKSCCVEIYLQIGPEATRHNMLLEMLAQVLQEPCFDTLRTKEQLGYIVASGVKRANGVQGMAFIIQSDKPAEYVEKRAEAFLHTAGNLISTMTTETFERQKKALAVKRSEKPKKLSSECNKHWSEISSQQYFFNRDEEEVKVLETITKEELVKFYSDYVACNAPLRHKLIIHVVPVCGDGETPNVEQTDGEVGKEETDFDLPGLQESVQITDFSGFKNSLTVYPSLEPYISTSLS